MFDNKPRKKVKVTTAPKGTRTPTLLYSVPLRGEDTGDVESLYSLLQRLAYAHGMPTSKLVNEIMPAQPEVKNALTPNQRNHELMRAIHQRGWGWGWGWDKDAGKLMLGTGASSSNWAKALGIATGQRYLDEGTVAALTSHVSSTDLITNDERICLACVREDAKSGGLPYERLLWRLGPVTCCPTHKKKLIPARCGMESSKAQDPYLRIKHPGVCCGCGAVAFTCITTMPPAATPAEVWRAQQCRDLLGDIATDWLVRADAMPLLMKQAIKAHALDTGGFQAFAERVGACKSNLSEWLGSHNQRTSLAQLLDIAWVEGLSLSELIKGQRVKVNTPEVCREPQRVPKQFKRVDHDALREAMRAAARDGRSASDVARELDVDLSTMARHADLYATLRRHTSHQQLADDTFRRNAAVYEARQMAESLLEAGAPVTLRNANDKSGDRWMPAQLRSQTLSIIARELDERDDSACTKVSAQTKAMAIEAANDLVKAKNPQASR